MVRGNVYLGVDCHTISVPHPRFHSQDIGQLECKKEAAILGFYTIGLNPKTYGCEANLLTTQPSVLVAQFPL